MSISSIIILIGFVLILIAIPVGIFFAVRALLRYNAGLHRKRSQEQEELGHMKIDDL